MIKMLCVVATLLSFQLSFAAFSLVPLKDSSSSKTTVQPEAVKALTGMTAKEYGVYRGKKLNFFQRISFRLAQKKAKVDPAFAEEAVKRFSFVGFLVGILFPPIGVIAAQFSSDPVFRRSAWIGFGVVLIVAGLVLLSYASSFSG